MYQAKISTEKKLSQASTMRLTTMVIGIFVLLKSWFMMHPYATILVVASF